MSETKHNSFMLKIIEFFSKKSNNKNKSKLNNEDLEVILNKIKLEQEERAEKELERFRLGHEHDKTIRKIQGEGIREIHNFVFKSLEDYDEKDIEMEEQQTIDNPISRRR